MDSAADAEQLGERKQVSVAFPSQAVGGLILEKPVDKQDAYRMLSRWVGPGGPPGTRGTGAGPLAIRPLTVSIRSSIHHQSIHHLPIPFIQPATYSLLTYPLVHLSIHYPLIHPSIHPLTLLSTYPSMRPSTYLLLYLLTHPHIC